jgi:hypothetical protein
MDLIPRKPKWMRWAAYNREVAEIERAEQTIDAHLCVFAEELGKVICTFLARRARPSRLRSQDDIIRVAAQGFRSRFALVSRMPERVPRRVRAMLR